MDNFPKASRIRGWLLALVFGLSVVCGCSTATPPLAATNPSALNEQVFAVGYDRISQIFLKPVELNRLTFDGLSGLRGIEPGLTVERTRRGLRVLVSGRLAGDFPYPAAGDSAGWATLTTNAIERARMLSPVLRDATAEYIYQVVFDAVAADLDSYSRYTSAQRASNERAQRDGYGGIGLSLDQTDGRYVVREVQTGGPADHAGIRTGEVIITIDGSMTDRMVPQEVRDHLRGTPGTTVVVTLGPVNTPPRVVSMTREKVIPNTVASKVNGRVGVLKIERFNASTLINLRDSIIQMQASIPGGPLGFVIDLRGNPGGLLDQAVAVANLFVRTGRIISTAGRHRDSWQQFDSNGEDIVDGLPLVVLVDGRSASASEVVAAALQDSGRAVVVGASSFGKGSVQTVTRLPNDGELFLTWSRIYAPSGYTLHKQGVQPTVCTSKGQRDADAVLAPLRGGRVDRPALFTRWRTAAPDDESALARLRESCPWKEHEAELDIKVAESLLADQNLFRNALALATTAVAEHR
ncbi:carboxyl-terminal processing protease [uncultured Gammaproteobacteria bacterium]